MKLEIDIEEDACDKALTLGVTNIKIKAAGHVGYPDRQFFIPGGRPLFIEFKRPGESPEPIQKVIHRRLRYYGYEVNVCDSSEEAVAAIKAALDTARLSKESCEILARARRSDPVTGPRFGEDEHHVRSHKGSKK